MDIKQCADDGSLDLNCVFVLCRAETVEDDDVQEVDASAFLLVRRKLANDKPEVGKPNVVTVEIYNAGKG
jgi:hypothetical protein